MQTRVGLWRRMAALFYDAFLVTAIWMLLGFVMLLFIEPNSNKLVEGLVQTDLLLDNILFILMVASSAAFYIYFWTVSYTHLRAHET